MDSRTIERVAAAWLARRERDDWGDADRRALEAWLAGSTAHRVALLRLEAAWAQAGRLQALAAGLPGGEVPVRGQWSSWLGGTEDEPARTNGAEGEPARLAGAAITPPDLRTVAFASRARRSPAGRALPGQAGVAGPARSARASGTGWRHALAAGALAVVAGLGWSAWQLGGRDQASYATAVGEVREVDLADGSRATLSSDSRLEVRMDRGARHVALVQGEAFFDVAHDTGRPFVVEAAGRRVVAVGTRYAVRRDADALRVVVTEGRVRLEGGPGGDGRAQPMALLPAGSVATAGRNGVLVRSLPLEDARRYLQWRDGFLAFDDAPLAQAAAEFNRFNARRLELADPAVAQLRIGGNFRWSNLDGFVGLLEQGFPVRAERHPDRIVLHSR